MKMKYIIIASLISLLSCKKMIDVGLPQNDLITESVFADSATATAALLGLYNQLVFTDFASGDVTGFSYLGGLSSDELLNYNTGGSGELLQQFNDNALIANNILIENIWSTLYKYIYKSNSIIEGMSGNLRLSESLKAQLTGEAKFLRAFSHFYLVNLFGDVPVVLTTDYRQNTNIGKIAAGDVYQQITEDLLDAQNLLSINYNYSNGEKIRANSFAATALLARVYLYTQQWSKAESEASKLLEVSELMLEPDLNNVFLANSKETIWQLKNDFGNTNDAATFVSLGMPQNAALREDFALSFEPGDLRQQYWVGVSSDEIQTYYFPYKYKVTEIDPISEYSTVLRLAEQYLIRAESRIQQNNIEGGIQDLNKIRKRARSVDVGSLPDLPTDLSLENALLAVESERFRELFSEWGHRWLDLKRTDRSTEVLERLKPNFSVNDNLYPIPRIQILNDPAMKNAQNPGYL